jgi:D-alanyl-D-alanine-carboxypeptidase/D-alanyl-D-alanine-endopeptidase
MRLGSITKAFAGEMLAHLAAEGTVALTDPLAMHAPDLARPAQPDERPIRLIDLATHSAGLPREVPHEPGPASDPFATITEAAFIDFLRTEQLLFEPGSAILYSNFGFDLLATGLAGAAQEPYPELFAKYITRPLGMTDTTFQPSDGQIQRLMQGQDFDGDPLPDVPTGSVIVGSGGLYSTPHDILQWLSWHLDRFGETDAEARLLDHAAWRQRDGLESVFGMDESGHMDAMGLGWVIMMPEGNRPLILQKAGGLQGIFTYVAFAPTRSVGAFVAISEFKFSAAMTMAETINELIATLAPR